MQFLKKVISLILVVAMVSSFALVASADSPNILLELYDNDGQALADGATIHEGETVKVCVKTTEERVITQLLTFIAYDSDLLEPTSMKWTAIKDTFWDCGYNLHTTVSSENQEPEYSGLPAGTPIVIGRWFNKERKAAIPADTTWIEYTFTAKKSGTADLKLVVMEAAEMPENSIDTIDIRDQFTPKGATVNIAAVPVSVDSVTISPNSVTLNPDGTQQLTATVSPAEATETVTWHSENEEVATVSDTGLVTAVGVGDTTITATAGGKSGSCTVKVEAAEEDPVTNFEIYGAQDRAIDVGDSVTLQVAMAMRDGSKPPQVNWVSDAPDIVSVAPAKSTNSYTKGKITGNAVGTAHVTASYGSHSVTFNITG